MVLCTRSYHSTVSCLSSYASNPTTAPSTSSTTQRKPHPPTPWQPRANLVTTNTLDNSSWLLDSGTSHYATTDLSNLFIHTPYEGSDDIMIGYGTGLPITPSPSYHWCLSPSVRVIEKTCRVRYSPIPMLDLRNFARISSPTELSREDADRTCCEDVDRTYYEATKYQLNPSFQIPRAQPPSQSNVDGDRADSPPSVQVRDNIDLTDKERQIFERLLQVVRHYTLQTQLRVAGGWVRDKLLGKECYDIDIAIDNMLGREFCEKVNEYLSSTGEKAQGVGVIQWYIHSLPSFSTGLYKIEYV
ncbi:polynucleotide adenylyltransferase family protein [Actinidia rufa]|uniref:Polynucleotide adenylyltransferase family protein n=1 Tax=Actinidia rufa TaxID=165716 RepID=A0A7J0EG70_9ERIC|nr:polynucleotide adenylyltransferase family protein [Actinidia rufa]